MLIVNFFSKFDLKGSVRTKGGYKHVYRIALYNFLLHEDYNKKQTKRNVFVMKPFKGKNKIQSFQYCLKVCILVDIDQILPNEWSRF